jgi:hypothetical protein
MSDVITTLLVQIKGDASSAVRALRDFAMASTTTATQVTVAQKTMADAGSAATAMGKDVEAAGKHVAGMSYYFRSGMDQIRFALMGGGERAGFYAVDELVRGLVSSGVGLGTLIPVIGGIAAALGTGWIAWEEWTKGERAAAEQAKELADTWKDLPGLIQQINDMQHEGLLSPQAAGQYADYLTGRKKLYVDNEGNITNQPTRQIQVQQDSSPIGGPWGTSTRTETVNNEQLNPTDPRIAPWIMQQATAGGTVTKEYLAALKQADDLTVKINEDALSGVEKQKQEIRDKGEKERAELQNTLELAKAQMTAVDFASSAKVKQIRQDIVQSFLNQSNDIATVEQAAKEKQVKQQLEAAQKAVDQIADQQRKQQEADKQHEEELQRQAQLQRDIQRSAIENQIDSVKSNALMTDREKLQIVSALQTKLQQINNTEIAELEALKAQVKSVSDQLELEKKIADLQNQNQKLSEANTPAKQDSFGFQFGSAVTDIQNRWTGWATEAAKSFQSTWEGATNGVSAGLTHLFEYGAQKGQWFREMWNGVVGSMISSFTQMAVSWVMNHVLMEVAAVAFYEVMKLLGLQDVAAKVLGDDMKLVSHITGETAATAATAAGVTTRITAHAAAAGAGAAESQASIPYVGPILAIAAVAAIVAAVMALAHGFKDGGYTGDGPASQVAGVVHAGEYVTPANRTSGAMNLLRAIHSGALTDASVPQAGAGIQTAPVARTGNQTSGQPTHVTHISVYHDKSKMINEIQNNDAHENWVVDLMAKNSYKFKS